MEAIFIENIKKGSIIQRRYKQEVNTPGRYIKRCNTTERFKKGSIKKENYLRGSNIQRKYIRKVIYRALHREDI